MAYIGKSPSTKFSAAPKLDTFTGDGSTVAFDVANIIPAGGENALQVFVNNIRQKPGLSNAFTVGNDGSSDLKRITFTAAPAASDEIYVITPYEATNIKSVGDGAITSVKIGDDVVTMAKLNLTYDNRTTATGDGSTVAFSINSNRTVNDVLVIVNGLCLVPTTDYTISSTTLTFVAAPAASAEIAVRYLPK
jgi:hypothetical protein